MPKQYLIRWTDDSVSYVCGDLSHFMEDIGYIKTCSVEEIHDFVFLTFEPITKSHNEGYGRTWPEIINTEREALDDLTQLLETGLMSDVTLDVAGQHIAAHKAILALRSPFFNAMFTLDMAEAKQKSVVIEGFSPTAVKSVLKFIYSGMIDYPSNEQLIASYLPPGEEIPTETDHTGELVPQYDSLKLAFLEELLAAADYFTLPSLTNLSSNLLYDFCGSFLSLSIYLKVMELGERYNLSAVIKERGAYSLAETLRWASETEERSILSEIPEDVFELVDRIWVEVLHIGPLLRGTDKELDELLHMYAYRQQGAGRRVHSCLRQVKELVAKGADVDRVQAFHVLCSGRKRISPEWSKLLEEVIRELASMGYSVNLQDDEGCTPLYSAAFSLHIPLVKVLLEVGADSSIVDKEGLSALDALLAERDKLPHDSDQQGDMEIVIQMLRSAQGEHSSDLSLGTSSSGLSFSEDASDDASSDETGSSKASVKTDLNTCPKLKDHQIEPSFVEQFMSGNIVDDRANLTYKLSSSGLYSCPGLHERMFKFSYPRLNSQLKRFTEHTGRAVKANHMSIRQILESALEADVKAARAGNGSGIPLSELVETGVITIPV